MTTQHFDSSELSRNPAPFISDGWVQAFLRCGVVELFGVLRNIRESESQVLVRFAKVLIGQLSRQFDCFIQAI